MNSGELLVNKSCFLALITACIAVTSANAQQSGVVQLESVARCIFVYAPLYEFSVSANNVALKTYTLERMMFVRGFNQARLEDLVFKRIFEFNLQQNKRAGVEIKANLNRAADQGDAAAHHRELEKAAVCDKELAITNRQ